VFRFRLLFTFYDLLIMRQPGGDLDGNVGTTPTTVNVQDLKPNSGRSRGGHRFAAIS
jgi:hypothetical protein